MKVLKFLKSVIIDLLKTILETLGIILSCGILLILLFGVGCIIAIPIHIFLFPQIDIQGCSVMLFLIISIVVIVINIIIELVKYFKNKWKEIK